ncbi:ribosomal RNA-processing protein 7 homolog A [Trichogramma pretiosum]|uniref:ribosomal RNA-processing protein 7 homolog A n=1 Tax=Trichogramma pretiosum TaxID=7493 RepID=UPI0006C99E5E|nr:ribosomal RNA-processing protein 7 homolog A [Trichogramma pretiosum]
MTKKKAGEDAEYTVVGCRFDKNSDLDHIRIKKHSVRNHEQEHPKGRTLFVLDVPPYATMLSLQRAFEELCGPVEAVYFQQNKDSPTVQASDLQMKEKAIRGFKTAYVVFKNSQSLDKAVQLDKSSVLTMSTDKCPMLVGLKKYIKNYNSQIPHQQVLKERVTAYLKAYDKTVTMEAEAEKAAEEPDADGWVTVTSTKKRGKSGVPRKASVIEKIHKNEEKKKIQKTLVNFYRGEIRQRKKLELEELKKKFELDKKKIELMKSTRKFKVF